MGGNRINSIEMHRGQHDCMTCDRCALIKAILHFQGQGKKKTDKELIELWRGMELWHGKR